MADMMGPAAAWLAGQFKAAASVPATYKRGAQSVGLQVTLGKDLLKLNAEDGGVLMLWTDADVLFTAADLVLGGVAVTPQRGDYLTLTLRGSLLKFELLSEGGEPPWRWADPYQTMIRVHLKYVGPGP